MKPCKQDTDQIHAREKNKRKIKKESHGYRRKRPPQKQQPHQYQKPWKSDINKARHDQKGNDIAENNASRRGA